MTSFVLGNGRSRLNIDPNRLKKSGTVYGCNAIYRDFIPDVLVAVDTKMVIELNEHNVQHITEVWTNPNKTIENIKGINLFSMSKGWSSGPTALWLAASRTPEKIYILGFDYLGIQNKINNVYADTLNYRKSTDPATFYGNWFRQTESTISQFKNITFIRVVEEYDQITESWNTHKNFKEISYDLFKNEINY